MVRGRSLLTILFVCLSVVSGVGDAMASPQEQLAGQILQAAGIEGGLVVHYGCGDGVLTAAIHDSNSFLVHGLDGSAANVAAARAHIKSLGLYGDVTAEEFSGSTLPYIENLVTLFVSEQSIASMPFDINEVLRILRPNGVAYISDGSGGWVKTVKPRPSNIDEWTHYLHDSTNNAVANDTVVGPPRRIQWMGSPKWSRQHDHMSSTTGFVVAGERIFYIIDEGSKTSIQLPSRWFLYARDGFNGTILWRKPIASFMTQMWPFKSGPAVLPRRLVASGDRVFVTLGMDGTGLSCLDAATGDVLWTQPSSVMTEEFVYSDGVLFACVKDSPPETGFNSYRIPNRKTGDNKAYVKNNFPWDETSRWIKAIDAATGTVLWQYDSPMAWLSLTADASAVYFHDGDKVIALNRGDGSLLWASVPVPRMASMQPNFGTTMVSYDGVIMFQGGDSDLTLTALRASDGIFLWSDSHDKSRSNNQYDLLVMDDKAWVMAVSGGGSSGVCTGWDPGTGTILSQFAPDVETHWFHSRCYRAKATTNYLIPSRNGNEFVDPKAETWEIHHWVRGSCSYGFIPCNGMIYNPPHSCGCYHESKLFAFNAVTPAHADPDYPQAIPDGQRLQPGPAYGEPFAADTGANDWPMYRCDPMRSGYSRSVVPAEVVLDWDVSLDGELSAPVIANGRVYVAGKDLHTLYALNETSGALLWSYMAGGRIDSPPTIYKGRVIFGSADGFLYCLSASDGDLIWRFQAAPLNLRMTAYEQVESVWPLPGTALVVNDTIYCVAGRSMFLDGGLRFLQIDPLTGTKLNEVVLDEYDPNTGENLQVHIKGMNMPVAIADILTSDGQYIYMKSQRFDMAGNREDIAPHSSNHAEQASVQYGKGMHLFAPTSLLDGHWFHRNYWIWGKSFAGGAGGWSQAGKYAPAGRILAFDDESVYGYGRRPEFFKWSTALEYHLFRAEKYPESESITYDWTDENVPILARAMALTDKILWVAGPEDLVDEEDAFDWWTMDPSDPAYDPDMQNKLNAQDEALDDKHGALIRAVLTSDGSMMAQYSLESMPVWDGVAAANGNLYVVTMNGKVKRFLGTNFPPSVDVGGDRAIYPAAPATLDPVVTDDGLPLTDPGDPGSDPVGLTASWSKVGGPGEITFGDANSIDTTAVFSEKGDYTLRLNVFDGGSYYYDDFDVSVSRVGDLDWDDDIDKFDLEIFIGKWMFGGCTELNNWCGGANQSGSGSVGSDSLSVIAFNWLLGVEPAAPGRPSATAGDWEITLNWPDNSEPDLGGYNVYRSVVSDANYVMINPSVLTSSDYVDSTASNFVKYFYVVTAVDIFGYESGYSQQRSATAGPQAEMKLVASLGITVDVNDLVSRWNDQGNNNDAKQTVWAEMPLYVEAAINGEPAIAFDGSGVHLDVVDSTDINKTGPFSAKTLLLVFKTGSDITSKQNIWEQGGNKAGGLNFYLQDGSLYINGWTLKLDDGFTDWGPTALNAAVSTDTVYVATLVMDSAGGTFEGFINGSSIGIDSSIDRLPKHQNDCAFGHTEVASRFHSGGHSNAANFTGLIAEFYEFNAVLSIADRQMLETVLMEKYGIE